ncbi:hypothetical protein [Streptomyces flavidovirens]|uniref:hypothetical protein n=1 Tax=Streptomyces flavidovirens TaxID=67298 RepID=UPI0003F68490|nr:hypothetical protein [Streptomyces flavidovirens]
MTAELGPDEARIRHYLVRLGDALTPPLPPKDPDVDRPITPTRIIPPGAPLPARSPQPDEAPPWRTPPPPPPTAPPPAGPLPFPAPPSEPRIVEVRHVHEIVLTSPDPDPDPSRWERITGWVLGIAPPWKIGAALAAAAVPIPWTGYSAGTTWAYTVGEARQMHMGVGYGLAFGCFALAAHRCARRRSLLALTGTAVTFIGLFGAMHWYDPILWTTGVRP